MSIVFESEVWSQESEVKTAFSLLTSDFRLQPSNWVTNNLVFHMYELV